MDSTNHRIQQILEPADKEDCLHSLDEASFYSGLEHLRVWIHGGRWVDRELQSHGTNPLWMPDPEERLVLMQR